MQPFLQPLDPASEKECLIGVKDGKKESRNALIEHNLRLVAHIVKKYSNSSRNQEDLMSTGIIGLCKAVDTFNPAKGNRLVTYASKCIENEIRMLLRQERKLSREVSLFEPLGKDKDGNELSLFDILEDDSEDVAQQMVQQEQLRVVLCKMQEVLTHKEEQLLIMRYGLQGKPPCTQKEAGERFGISRSYVSRMEKKALQKLRRCL